MTATIGSLPLFFLMMKRPYGVQEASATVYTILAVFFTRRVEFDCPCMNVSWKKNPLLMYCRGSPSLIMNGDVQRT